MKYCPFCGAPNELENVKFCMKCGSRFPAQAEKINESTSLPQDERNSGNRKLIIIDAILAVIIVTLITLLAAGVFSA